MDIKLIEGQYKSISTLEWVDIPKFAVITGANGSGKTQLLELIARSAGVYVPPPGASVRYDSPGAFNAKLKCSEDLNSQNTVFLRSHWDIVDSSASIQQVYDEASQAWDSRLNFYSHHADDDGRSTQWESLWDALCRLTNIPREQFTREQFDAVLPANFLLMRDGATRPAVMQTSIPLLFVSYANKMHHLEREGFSEEEISEKIGMPPWVAVNIVLDRARLDYRVEAPIVKKASWTQNVGLNYGLMLRNINSGAIVPASELSSGERVLFLTSIWSYFFNQSALNSKTALLLLDEPDAHLHPALTSIFLRVIRDELVERRGIRVIATTHSPSTVALVEQENLFVMLPTGSRIRSVVNKWEPVAYLTAGLVTVGTQTKTVFVEDKDDADFYQAVQAILVQGAVRGIEFDRARSLNFVAASTGRQGGGKNMVIDWVKKIETTQVAGIVDRDEDAEPTGRLYAGVRRHLESYLWDPLFVYALLLDENKSDRPNFMEGVDHRHSKSFSQLDNQMLQRIADGMVLIYAEIAGSECGDLVVVSYIGGVNIMLPQWIIRCDMKKLMESLRKRLGVSWSLQYLSRKYEVLGIVPIDLANVLIEIQKA